MANQLPIRIAADFEERYPNASARATECAMNLVFTADLLTKRIAALVQPFDLSPESGLALSILADSASPLPPNKIASRLIISRASVTSLIDSLERRGYVTRKPHLTDRRMLLIELTDSGRETASAFRLIVHQHQKQWLAALDEVQQEQLIETLHLLQATLMKAEEENAVAQVK